MLKKSAVASALFFISVSSNVHALGLGALDMRSALNQPMNAVIDLTSASGADLSKIKVSLASQQAHDRTGLSRARFLADFKFSVEQDGRGNAFIKVTSSDSIREPFVEFLLEVEWPSGRLLREYTILVDPPVTMPARPVTPVAPVSRAPAPVVQSTSRPDRPVPVRPAMAPVQTTAAPAPVADSYGPVKRNETLWTIANRVRPGSDISVDQMMHALLRANPQAFMNNNINQLKAGATLRIPDREQIKSISTNEARAESNRQAREWKEAQDTPVQESVPQDMTGEVAAETEVITESHLQLTAPEEDAIEGAATASSGDPQAADGETAEELNTQLALATEEAEASKAQSEELQTRVVELEEQIETMKRLLELKDDALADLQQQEASEMVPDIDTGTDALDSIATEVVEESATDVTDEQPAEEPVEDAAVAAAAEPLSEPRGIVNKLMDNPVLAGLGVLVALILGGFLWASTRRKGGQGIFDNEMTLEKHMASESATKDKQQVPVVDFEEEVPEEEITPIQGHDESDPVTEADVYLAYGRIQQAEDVLQAALERTPDDVELRIKLLEVYHSSGNIAAFDREAASFHDNVSGDGSQWLRVAAMGYALSPTNQLYSAAGDNTEKSDGLDFDVDLSGLDDSAASNDVVEDTDEQDLGLELPESIEFSLIDVNNMPEDEDEDDASEGLLDNADEVATKLDLARAYMDMGDPDGARSILDEVMHEGNEEQKHEAEDIISQLA